MKDNEEKFIITDYLDDILIKDLKLANIYSKLSTVPITGYAKDKILNFKSNEDRLKYLRRLHYRI